MEFFYIVFLSYPACLACGYELSFCYDSCWAVWLLRSSYARQYLQGSLIHRISWYTLKQQHT